ncbi:MAG: 16S rRNA (adenine(1518)-N(6)/adenine(1519)-N(6))-dimethyltransferase RsmA [Patescibacteria group bacterium]
MQYLRVKAHRPKKSLGQNFLHDRRILEKIVHAASISKEDTVIEIGPGKGILTTELAKLAGHLIAIEKDRDLIRPLHATLSDFNNVELLNEDVLDYTMPKNRYKLVANIPYYITSPILTHFLHDAFTKNLTPPTVCILLVQKEVAQKICAAPPDMNVLALNIQTFGKPKIISYVSRNAFSPKPNVDSAIIRIDVFKKPAVDCDLAHYFELIHAGFSQKRKTLANSLKKLGGVTLLQQAGINPTCRAETLTISEWQSLALN